MKAIVHKLTRSNEFYVFLVIVALSVVIQARSGQFFTANNLVDIANAMVVPGLFGIGAFMVLVSGGIDVSFPALASLAVYAMRARCGCPSCSRFCSAESSEPSTGC